MSDGAVLASITSCTQPQLYAMLIEVFITKDIIMTQPGPRGYKTFFMLNSTEQLLAFQHLLA